MDPVNNSPLFVFIPGTLCTKDVFCSLLENTSHEHCVVEFKLHDTLQEMVQEVLKKSNHRQVILVGFSMGVMVAFECLRSSALNVVGMILINGNCHADLPERKSARDLHLDIAKENGLDFLIREHYLSAYFPVYKPSESSLVIKMATDLGVEVFEAQLKVLAQRPDSLNTIREFKHPMLIIGSDKDMLCPVEHQQLMSNEAVNAELRIISDCGHFSLLEKPVDVAHYMNQWISRWYG